uniref:Uncharacterized protein n=1 Tax=Megaselia scalaris TaxID=36166 RepID=T1GR10_MEGSC
MNFAGLSDVIDALESQQVKENISSWIVNIEPQEYVSKAVFCGLNINLSKAELVLFNTKHTAPNLILPHLDDVSISLFSEAQYLRFIPVSKLKWERGVHKKSLNARSTFGKTWDLMTKIMAWLL